MRAGRILIACLILTGLVGGFVSGSAIYSRLVYLGLLLLVGAWIWTQLIGKNLQVHRNARILRASLGDIFLEHFEITNMGRLVAPWVEVVNESPMPFASGSRLLTLVGSHQNRSYLARTWLIHRGTYPLGPSRLSSGDPFGLFRVSKLIPSKQSLTVLPLVFEIQSFLSPPGLLPGGQVIRRRAIDMTPHAAGVREYLPGDPFKRIHWPTSIRRSQLMVKEFDQDPQAEVWLILDAQENVHSEKPYQMAELPVETMLLGRRPKFYLPPSTLEYAISIAASLAHYFIHQRRSVGLVTAGKTYTVIPAERSDRQESKIIETLAFIEAHGKLSIAGLVSAQVAQLPKGSSAILITPSIGDELLVAAEELQQHNLRPVVILLAADTFGGMKGSQKLVDKFRERRIPLCLISCGDNIGNVLSGFSSPYVSKDISIWQRPPLSHLI
jgi:uncharacterized protein (DUF58 family)